LGADCTFAEPALDLHAEPPKAAHDLERGHRGNGPKRLRLVTLN
jgi:hypothetical protein